MLSRESVARNSRGFTLVEMAIVLVIVGLLLGLGSSMVGTLMTTIKVRETKDLQDATVQSVISWASANNRLPDTALPLTSATIFANVAKTPNDAWGRPFIYIYDNALGPSTATKDTICGRKSTVMSLTDSGTGASISNVAYVVVSQADDATTDTKIAGVAVTSGPKSAITVVSADTAKDIVRWVTLDELRSKVGCQGAPLKIVNNELPYGLVSSPTSYSAMITADGGVQSTAPDTYSWCIQTTTLNVAPALLTFQKLNSSGVAIAISSVANLFQTSCSGYAVASWPQAGQLVLSGTPSAPGSYYFTVYVNDSNSNQVSKPFVLTVSP